MRSLVLVMIACGIAQADPQFVPMRPIADRAAACAKLQLDPKAKCEIAGKLAIAGLGTAELHVAKGAKELNYAVVVDAGGKLWLSDPSLVTKSACGMGGLCDVLDDAKPSLRTVTYAGKPIAAAVIDQRFHREQHKAVLERWTAVTLIACGAPNATPVCTTRRWGAQGNACVVDFKPDGDVDAKCAHDAVGASQDEANQAYDRGDYDGALAKANAVLAKDPGNVRMLRLVVSIKCISGDAAGAQTAATKLPAADRAQMKIRCDRYGVKL